MQSIEFNSLSDEEKAKVIDAIIKIITDPKTAYYTPTGIGIAYVWLKSSLEEGFAYASEIGKFCNDIFPHSNPCFFYAKNSRAERKDFQAIIFTKLPERVLGLLAIIHRPMYEYYKKAVSEE